MHVRTNWEDFCAKCLQCCCALGHIACAASRYSSSSTCLCLQLFTALHNRIFNGMSAFCTYILSQTQATSTKTQAPSKNFTCCQLGQVGADIAVILLHMVSPGVPLFLALACPCAYATGLTQKYRHSRIQRTDFGRADGARPENRCHPAQHRLLLCCLGQEVRSKALEFSKSAIQRFHS